MSFLQMVPTWGKFRRDSPSSRDPDPRAGWFTSASVPATSQCAPVEASDSTLRVSFDNSGSPRTVSVPPPRARLGREHGCPHALATAARSPRRVHLRRF